MSTVLITAFQPYDHWAANASWLALVELTKQLPHDPQVTTRLYPVDLPSLKEQLSGDLASNYDYALHLGQAPGASSIQLESIGLNVGSYPGDASEGPSVLVEQGPIAYRSTLPLASWARKLRDHGIPVEVSFHAGIFLCNAALYLSLFFAEQQQLKTRSVFIHLPLDVSQACSEQAALASLPAEISARAIRLILQELCCA